MRRNPKFLFATAAILLSSGMVKAIVPPNYDAGVHDRFLSGYVETVVMTQPPTPNTGAAFLGHGYDLSGIGWNTVMAPGCSATVIAATMLSPVHIAHAQHLGIPEGKVTFYGGDGQLHYTTQQEQVRLLSSGDGALGLLTTPVPRSAQVATYAILDRGDTPANYAKQPLLVYGRAARFATSSFGKYETYDPWNATSGTFTFDNVRVIGGDSGSPTFIPYAGQLTLAGTHWYTYGTAEGSYLGGIDAAWVNPYMVAAANAQMASGGYAVKVIAVPTKTWDGGAGNGSFTAAANWDLNIAPNREGIAFDAGSANGRYNIDTAGANSIKGITFTSTAGTGFTFSSSIGSTLLLGTGGLINNSPQTQTFNNDIKFYYLLNLATPNIVTGAQHWSANAGNLAINGNVDNNGFQLVVDGTADTAIAGVISGTGGVGKEGRGKLSLSRANLYTGNTTLTEGVLAVSNTSGSATGAGNVNVWGGRLQGNGSISGSVVFRAIGDPQWLAPGHADLSQRGALTIGGGVILSTATTMEIHISGTDPGSGYDQLVVTGGNVNLGGAVLDLRADGFSATGQSMLWILNNIGGGTLAGEYAGLGNGETLLLGNNRVTVYYGADYATGAVSGGNDVALLIVPVPEPAGLGLLCLGWVVLSRRMRSKK